MKRRSRRAIVYVAWDEQRILEAVTSATTARFVGVDRQPITNLESRRFRKPVSPFERGIEQTFSLPRLLAKSEMCDLLPRE